LLNHTQGNQIINQIDKVIIITTLLALVGCAGGSSVYTYGDTIDVYTSGDTIDIANFKGIIELNTDAISGEVKHNTLLRLNVEENIAKALRGKYKSMGSYSVFLMTASKAELKMNNHRALRDRGYTHLLIAALNPEINHTSNPDIADKFSGSSSNDLSMAVSCTIYRLTDGMPVALVNADVYRIDKNYWGREAVKQTGTISKRWQLGPIYSCDLVLKTIAQ